MWIVLDQLTLAQKSLFHLGNANLSYDDLIDGMLGELILTLSDLLSDPVQRRHSVILGDPLREFNGCRVPCHKPHHFSRIKSEIDAYRKLKALVDEWIDLSTELSVIRLNLPPPGSSA